jgi:hypothetical protein
MVVEVIFRYRTLIGKCELGLGLDFDEMTQVAAIERAFEGLRTRRFRRESVELSVVLRGDRFHDRVELVELGPGGFVCCGAPYVAHGEAVELTVEIGEHCYRFGARAVWIKEDGDDYRIGFEMVGMAVRLRRVAFRKHRPDIVDQLAAA